MEKTAEALFNSNPIKKKYAKQLREESSDRERDQPKEEERRLTGKRLIKEN